LYSPEEWTTPELRRDWQGLVERQSNPRLIYQTPEWFDHIASLQSQDPIAVAVTRDLTGEINGIAPFRIARGDLEFHLAGRTLGRFSLRKALVLGGLPLFPENQAVLDKLFAWMWSFLPGVDGIGLSGVEVGSFLWRYLHSSRVLRDRYLLHVVEGVRPYHILPLPPTFEEYLAQYNAKKRYNLKRQIRIFRERGIGRLELHRLDSPGDVQCLLDAEAQMVPDPQRFGGRRPDTLWSRRKTVDMAERGFLRSYVLTCGDEPISVIKGLQYGRTYSILETLYRKDYASLSPGAAILYMVVEDLLKHRPAQLIDFGFGEPNPKHYTSNVTLEMACVLLLRKTFGNRIRRGIHTAFFSAVRQAKRIRDRIESRQSPEPCPA
jgi:CelD/BcsL family acetyltransferase involved in cellulose biosynthesis